MQVRRWQSLTNLDNEVLSSISLAIRDRIFVKSKKYRTSVFLCGADINDDSKFRQKVAKRVFGGFEGYYHDLLYPEDLFEDFLYRSKKFNLLELEDILARSVDVVIVIPESAGSIAELGAFANNVSLRAKLICVIDEKYKKERSFLNYGPIALIKQQNKKNVIYMNFDDISQEEKKTILSAVRRIKKSQETDSKQIHFLQLEDFLLPLIYLLEPVRLSVIYECVKPVLAAEEDHIASTYASIQLMLKKKFLTLSNDRYFLSQIGIQHYYQFLANNSKKDKFVIQDELDKVRVEVLNYRLRRKPINL